MPPKGCVARGDRPTNRPVPAVVANADADSTRANAASSDAREATRARVMTKTSAPDRGTTVAVVRAEGSNVDAKTTGLVRPRRMRCDATTARDGSPRVG